MSAPSPILVAGYDGTSRVPGAAAGAVLLYRRLRTLWPRAAETAPLVLSGPSKSSQVWGHRLYRAARDHAPRLMLGGDHFVTFPRIEALRQSHPDVRLVVLDAHHDAYDAPTLSHYSVLGFVAQDLRIPTMVVGVRKDLDQAGDGVQTIRAAAVRDDLAGTQAALDAFCGDAPVYLSIDVDVLEPDVFAHVSDPVANGLDMDAVCALVRARLRTGHVVAADVVEFNAMREGVTQAAAQVAVLDPLLEEVAAWLG